MRKKTAPSIIALLVALPCGCFSPDSTPGVDTEGDASSGTASSATAEDGGGTVNGPMTAAVDGTEDTTSNADETADGTGDGTADGTDDGIPDGTDDGTASGTGGSVCGDGMVTGDEICDDSVNDGSYGGCAADCASLGPYCGDGLPNGKEACDDGNAAMSDGCNPDCVVSGTELWCRTYDGGGFDSGLGVAVGPDDEVVVVGQLRLLDGERVAWVRMYDDQGTVVWTEQWQSAPGLRATGRGVAFGGGQIVVTGSTSFDLSNLTPQEVFVNAYSLIGDLSWERSGPQGSGEKVAMDDAGNAFVVGTASPTMGDRDLWVRRYDANGATVWTVTEDIGASSDDLGRDIALRGDTLAVAANTDFDDAWLRAYEPDGDVSWTESGLDRRASAVTIDPNGNPALVAGGGAFGVPVSQIWLRKFDSQGNTEWTEIDESFDGASVCANSVGNLIVGAGGQLRKYDPDGQVLETTDGGMSNFGPVECVVDSNDNVLVVGSYDAASSDIYVCKYAP